MLCSDGERISCKNAQWNELNHVAAIARYRYIASYNNCTKMCRYLGSLYLQLLIAIIVGFEKLFEAISYNASYIPYEQHLIFQDMYIYIYIYI